MSQRLFLVFGALIFASCSEPEADTDTENSTPYPEATLSPSSTSTSEPDASNSSPSGAGAGGSAITGVGGATAGIGGTTSGTGGTTSGTGGTTAGTGGTTAGTGGTTTGNGGTTAGTGGGSGASAAGAGGTGSPTGGAGSSGAAGSGSTDLTSIAADFHQLRLECPCIDPDHFGPDKQDNCDAAPEVDRQTYIKTLGGDPDVTYDVKLHVRGNTEPNTYVGGTLEQERFYIGGQTSTPGYTAYMLTVEEPNQVYFFNHNPTTGHLHFLIDYEVVIPMRGGTTVSFEVNGGSSVPDGHGVSNREELVVPGIPPAPEPFNGQLVQFDVVSVEPQSGNP